MLVLLSKFFVLFHYSEVFMKWLLSLIVAFSFVFIGEVKADVVTNTCSGLNPGEFVDISFTVRTSAAPTLVAAYGYTMTTNTVYRSQVFLMNVDRQYYLKSRADSSGSVYVMISSNASVTTTVSSLTCTPEADQVSKNFSMIVSFLIGSLTAVAFVIAVDTAWQGGQI